jgi:predicted ATPase
MRTALARHDDLIRAAVAACGGYVFGTGGDGFAVAFSRAGDALAAARDIQEALAGAAWPRGAELRVRMGAHTGEVEERDGNYFGPAVNRAARLMAAGHGGQILVSQATVDVAGPGGLVDRGEHRLRDLTAPERLWQLGSGVFPPLRTVDALATNLPRLLTSFVGRERELVDVAKAVGERRVVTLTGVGGVGKTRLALQCGADLLDRFADGVWLVELADVAGADAVAAAVASALGIGERLGMGLVASIVDALRPRDRLVILDNCEHVLDAAAELVVAVARGCPGVRVLATSREALGTPGEFAYRVPSLAARSPDDDAARLFVERAGDAQGRSGMDPGVLDDVLSLCQALDGIPLAIELAAARSVSLSPKEIGDRLRDRFRLLRGRGRGSQERHQTLRATVDWSYGLLDPVEQALFRRLAVFIDGFTLAAAEAIGAGDPVDEAQVVDVLDSLVAKSLVAIEGSTTTRYRLLETLRQYASERLVDAGEVELLEASHADHYLRLAREWIPGIYGDRDVELARPLAAERANLVTALDQLLADDRPSDASVVFECVLLALMDLRRSECFARAAAVVDHCRAGRDDLVRARIRSLVAYLAHLAGDYERALADGRAALAAGYRHPAALTGVGSTLVVRGNHDDEGFALLHEAAGAIVDDVDEAWRLHAVANYEGMRAWRGQADHAIPALDRALVQAEALGNEMAIAGLSTTRGTAMVLSDLEGAVAYAQRGVSSSWGCYGQAGRAWALHIAAGFQLLLDQPAEGIEALASDALDVSWDRGLLTGVTFSLLVTAGLAIRERRLDAGTRLLAASETFARQHGIIPYGSYEFVHDWIVTLADERLGSHWRDQTSATVDVDRVLRDARAVLAELSGLAKERS